MKKIKLWIVLITGILVLLGSCAKDDDDDSSTTTSITSTSASGSITVGSETLSGTYASPCTTSNVSIFAALGYYPSDVKSVRSVIVVTGDSAFSDENYYYSDTECSEISTYIIDGLSSVTIGDATGSNYKVSYTETSFKLKANTTAAETFWETSLQNAGLNADLTVGEEYTATSNSAYYSLWYVTSSTIQTGTESESAYPTSVSTTVYTKQ